MSIDKLFVEGKLDIELLNPILRGAPVLQPGGSKNSLKPRAKTERYDNKVKAGYLRDRDFDFDPPEDLSKPVLDAEEDGIPIGWRWCRHEIENYLMEPAVISEATGWPAADVHGAICRAAKEIRVYEAARWTVGIVRRALPPHYELRTRPVGLSEIALPHQLDCVNVNLWAMDVIDTHRTCIVEATDPANVKKSFEVFGDRFDEAFISKVSNILLWFSGKDVLAGMSEWLLIKGFANPGLFRASVRDWMRANPERVLELLPEWTKLREVLRS